MTDLAGRTTLVTGAGSGIGRLLALEVARRGGRLVLWDLDIAAAEAVVEEIRAMKAKAMAYRCDVGDHEEVGQVAQRVLEDFGAVDIVVNNAGVVSGKPFLELTPADVERTFRVNVLSLYWVTGAFLPGMVRRGSGHVVTIASAAGLVGVARQTDYSASKHAAVGFDESLRVELAKSAKGVHTTVVCPYYIDTGMFEGVKTRFRFLLPILQPDDVVTKIVGAIEADKARLVLPPIVKLLPVAHALPPRLADRLMGFFGVNRSMDQF
ncbi:MAG TPA: SDR family oxidoreductase, partial [Acidimicrobiales bacterium]|nr:SDR family oxidoreductase [Acidimicrobiales bacterium]